MYLLDQQGKPYGGLRKVESASKKPTMMLMNGGMYQADLSAVGLYVEDGVESKNISTKGGWGNFHLLPNGVFWERPVWSNRNQSLFGQKNKAGFCHPVRPYAGDQRQITPTVFEKFRQFQNPQRGGDFPGWKDDTFCHFKNPRIVLEFRATVQGKFESSQRLVSGRHGISVENEKLQPGRMARAWPHYRGV